MKKLIMVTLFSVLTTLYSIAQNRVDIELVQSPTNCQILLWPKQVETATLSNLVFTLKWKTGSQVAVGDVLRSPIPIHKVGAASMHEGYTYQVYVGLGFGPQDFQVDQPTVIVLDKQGASSIVIADDQFASSSCNGEYYISIGGQDVTGKVMDRNQAAQVVHTTQHKLYYDLATQQVLVERGGVFSTVLNQVVGVGDRSQLRLIK